MTSVYPGRAPVPRTPRRTPAGNGFVLQGPWGGLQQGLEAVKSSPLSPDSSSALAESARERPELGMTPPSKVPDGFIRRPELRFPSPLNFPALLFFMGTCFSNSTNTFSREASTPYTTHPPLPPAFSSTPFTRSHLFNLSFSRRGKAFHIYEPFRGFLPFSPATLLGWECVGFTVPSSRSV